MINHEKHEKPIVYSCSGCSSAAQMANYIAVQMDRKNLAEMSCIAGVGGNVKKLVKTARSGRKIIVIDGCPLACSRACLANHSIQPDVHIDLSLLGVSKKQHEDFDKEQADKILETLKGKLEPAILNQIKPHPANADMVEMSTFDKPGHEIQISLKPK